MYLIQRIRSNARECCDERINQRFCVTVPNLRLGAKHANIHCITLDHHFNVDRGLVCQSVSIYKEKMVVLQGKH
jgi:hypothetical protein